MTIIQSATASRHANISSNAAIRQLARDGVEKKAIDLPELIDRALRSKRKVKRGETITSVSVAEILVERLVQTMTTGSARDLALVVQLLERYLPNALAAESESLEIVYHRSEGSNVPRHRLTFGAEQGNDRPAA